MHTMTCTCPGCCGRRDALMPLQPFAFAQQPRPLSEEQEIELAMELLGISSEEEMDAFLGKMFKGIGRGLKKVGSFAGKILKPLGGALKGLAKTALPFVGGALGSLIPIPGVGTALGTALGSAVSKALEMEVNELEQDEAELEMARRFVRIASDATQQALANAEGRDSQAVVRNALLAAVRSQVPQINESGMEVGFEESGFQNLEQEVYHLGPYGGSNRPVAGQWSRRGRRIALFDV